MSLMETYPKPSELNQKIMQLVEALSIPYAQFADLVDVSRPIISHIITGRNKPSLEVIQKIMTRFPELGYKWHLDGEVLPMDQISRIQVNRMDLQASEEKQLPSGTPSRSNSTSNESEKKVVRILVFYDDNTFSEFKPA
ncbi:MAG: helix-turn-helix domain-containing protein [Spirosomataceae bacterium]